MTKAIQFQAVSKYYYRAGARQILSTLWGVPPSSYSQIIKSVDNVTFEIEQGESVGLIGHNGAGKTTIFKLLSQITHPTAGNIHIQGRLSALIQLGAGFHPDLTGRDNIYLNGAILGLSHREIQQRFDEIVHFSELESFLDTPVKYYSSGMYARLGFSVAVHVSPDILLVDEVLAVGDTAFQYKCLQKMKQFVENGHTVIFVSHNLDAVQNLCQRVLWLHHGQLNQDGDASSIIQTYLMWQQTLFLQNTTGQIFSTGGIQIQHIYLLNQQNQPSTQFASGETITVELKYHTSHSIPQPHFVLGVATPGYSLLFLASTMIDDWQRPDIAGTGILHCRFHPFPLMPRQYQLWGEIRADNGLNCYVEWQPFINFEITTPPAGISSQHQTINISHLRNNAPIYIPHEWHIIPCHE